MKPITASGLVGPAWKPSARSVVAPLLIGGLPPEVRVRPREITVIVGQCDLFEPGEGEIVGAEIEAADATMKPVSVEADLADVGTIDVRNATFGVKFGLPFGIRGARDESSLTARRTLGKRRVIGLRWERRCYSG